MRSANYVTGNSSVSSGRWRVFRTALSIAVLLGSANLSAEIPALDRVRVLEQPVTISDIQLTNQDGEDFSLSQLEGKVALVFLGFTECRDVCPLTMEQFRQFRESDEVDVERTAFVMISVDGERDTPEVMKSFLGRFSPDFIGLTAEPEVVKPLAEQFGTAFYKQSSAHKAHDYDVAHSPQAFVLDTEGRLRAELYFPAIETMGMVTRALLEE